MSDTSSTEDFVNRGCDLAEAGDYEGAALLFEQAMATGASWVGLNLGNAFMEIGNLEAARAAYTTAWLAGDEDAGYNLADLLEGLGELAEAGRLYSELVRREYSPARIALAWMRWKLGKQQQALELLRGIAYEDSDTGRLAAGILGHWLWHRGDPEAPNLLRRGSDAYPSARTDLADALIAQGSLIEAHSLLLEGIASGEVDSFLSLGNLYLDEGQPSKAEEMYRAGAEAGDAHAAFNLGLLLEQQGDAEEAKRRFQQSAKAGDSKALRKLRDQED